MINSNKEKAHARSMGLDQYLADFEAATLADVAGNEILENLINNHGNTNIYKLHCDITIFSGQLKGEIKLGTANSLGLVMQDSKAQIVNLASVPVNGKGRPFIADTAKPSAFILGSMGFNDVIIAIDNLTDAINCYNSYIDAGVRASVITSIVPSLFRQTVAEFEKVRQLTIIVTALPADKAKLKQLEGMNVKAVVCEHTPIYEAIQYGASYNDLIADAEVIDLQTLGKPKPKLINQTLPPVKNVTDGMLPGSLQRYVNNHAERLSTPPEYIAIPLITALASVIGTKVSIYPKMYDDWEIVPNIWGAIIGNPSTKKSPALDAGMKPLKNLTYKAKADYEQSQKDFAAQREINEFKTKAVKSELQKLAREQVQQTDDAEHKITDDDLKAKAQTIAETQQANESEPIMKRYIANDGTYQKLGEILTQTNNGLLVERDELTALLASFNGEQNNDARNFYLEAFNGTGSHVMDRVIRGSIFIEHHCLSVVGGIQPNKLERYLEKTIKGLDNDGLMQRFQLAVYPDHIKGLKERDIAPNAEIRQIVYDLFETIDNMSLCDFIKYGANPVDDYHKRPYYHFTDDAYKKFMNWYDEQKAKADECEHSVIAEHITKYPKTIASLALIFHLVDCIEHGASLGAVSMIALDAALAWHDMLETHMMRIYSIVTDSANIKASNLADRIIKMIKNGGNKTDKTDWVNHGFTARDLHRKNWKGLTDSEDVLNALDILVGHDWLTWQSIESTGQGGRPTERYYINSRLRELL